MIQILGLRSFIGREGTSVTYDKDFGTGIEIQTVQELFTRYQEVLGKIPSNEHWNLFYTIASCTEKKRDFSSTRNIAFDLDKIEVERSEEYIDVVCGMLKVRRQDVGIVLSGNGLHFLVQLNQEITDKEFFKLNKVHYIAVCHKIKLALDACGLAGEVDTVVFEPRRILRLPGTVNRKPDKPEKKCTLLQGIGQSIDFDLAKLSGVPIVGRDEQVDKVLLKRYPNTDPQAVLSGCNFLNHCHQNPNDIDEPTWYAALSIVARLDGQGSTGNERGHTLSQGHKGYSRDATDQKITQALEASGPRTCDAINSLWGKCGDCPHFGKITSPITIIGAGTIRTEATGFHNVTVQKNGETKFYPNFEDLISYFKRERLFRSLGDSRQVYVWKDTHYVQIEKASLEAFAREKFDPKPTCKSMEEFRRRVEVDSIVPVEWWEMSLRRKMNFLNGYLDIDTMEFRPHDPDVAFRHVLPYAYDPSAVAPAFAKMTELVTGGDKDMAAVLEEYMGYALSNDDCWAQKALVLTGEGSNGKSTFLEVLAALAGDDNYSTVNLAKVDENYNLSQLDKKLFNISEETPPEALQKSHTFKNLVVGGRIVVRVPHKAPYHISNSAKLILTCNELPSSPDNTHGFYRRLLIVPFNQVFEKGQPDYDPHMAKRLHAELPGILNLALRGYRRALANAGFTQSKKIQDSLDEYRMENDSVLFWVKENLIVYNEQETAEHFIPISDLYAAYRSSMISMSIVPLNSKRFARRLRMFRSEVWGTRPYNKRATKQYVKAGGKSSEVRGLLGVEVQAMS